MLYSPRRHSCRRLLCLPSPSRAEPIARSGIWSPNCAGPLPPAQSLFPKHKSVPRDPASCPIKWTRLWPRRSLPRRTAAGMPSIIRPVSRPCNRRNRKSQKAFASVPGAPGASFASWMILRSGAAPLQRTKQSPLPYEAVLSAIILRLCPRPLWKAFRQDQASRSITNFTQN